MRQVLFTIPLDWLHDGWALPINTYGMMLFFAFVGCSAMAKRMCRRERIDPELIPDLIIWLFVAGIAGGRAVFVAQYWHEANFAGRPLWHVIALWDGGLVLYGALFGGAVGYFAYHHYVLRKHGVSHWKMLDVIAPCLAVGIAFGRIGCLGTGCCYGNVACEHCPAIHFPLWNNSTPAGWSPAAMKMIQQRYQTPLGFQWGDRGEVEAVEPGSPAAKAGLRDKDFVTGMELIADGKEMPIHNQAELLTHAGALKFTVERGEKEVQLPPFEPATIGLHPTQVYETISMVLLLFFLLSYYPYKRHDGELMVLFMFGYGAHRFLNEMLRTDTDPVAFGLTLSQNVSILVWIGAAILSFAVWRRPIRILAMNPSTAIAAGQP
jgi:phosphatidylglycerol---prolipoprotein diacylglyceryl transferase